jgi:hypothetical protein
VRQGIQATTALVSEQNKFEAFMQCTDFYLGVYKQTNADAQAMFVQNVLNTMFNLDSILVTHATNVYACQSSCTGYSSCVAYSFNNANGECRMVNDAMKSAFVASVGHHVYFKSY